MTWCFLLIGTQCHLPFTKAAETAGAQDIPPENITVGDQNVLPQNRLLWRIFGLLFWETADTGVALKSRPFMKRHSHLWKKHTLWSTSSKKASLRWLLWRLFSGRAEAWAPLVAWSSFLLVTLAPVLLQCRITVYVVLHLCGVYVYIHVDMGAHKHVQTRSHYWVSSTNAFYTINTLACRADLRDSPSLKGDSASQARQWAPWLLLSLATPIPNAEYGHGTWLF